MNLAQLKTNFRTLSGRDDLVNDDTTGLVEAFINQGCRQLDRMGENQKTWGVHFTSASVGSFHVSFPYCRAVKEVWVRTTEATWQLKKKPLQNIIAEYLASNDDIENGTPLYYSPTITRRIPEDVSITGFSSFLTYMDTSTDLDHEHNAIIFNIPTDTTLLVEIRGLFYSKELVNEDDENYWSVNHPFTLLKAALRELEIFNQNKTKTDQWTEALMRDLDTINKDLVEELIAETDQMNG